VDTLRIFIYRASKGVNPLAADRNHIHHRLMAHGLGHRGTTAVLYAYAIVMVLLSLFARDVQPNLSLLLLSVAAFALAMLPFAIPLRKKS
jgi:UDP-N-acetylmuramyl pentapeptide phosphotransferase/UDP-N-acetylglucosamine-1-phosphate transferase